MNENNDDFSLDIMKEMHEADATDANADNLARLLSSYYDALVRKGFTPPQAFDLLRLSAAVGTDNRRSGYDNLPCECGTVCNFDQGEPAGGVGTSSD